MCGVKEVWVSAELSSAPSPRLGNLWGMTYNLSTKPQCLPWFKKPLPRRPCVKAEEMDWEGIKPRREVIYLWADVGLCIPHREHRGLNGFWLRVWGQGSCPQLNLKCVVGCEVKRGGERGMTGRRCGGCPAPTASGREPALVFQQSLKEDTTRGKNNGLKLPGQAWPSSRQDTPSSPVSCLLSSLPFSYPSGPRCRECRRPFT